MAHTFSESHPVSIVLIEDDTLLSDLLCVALKREFKSVALAAFTLGRKALEHCRQQPPDLVMVDLGLPDMDGRKAIRGLHAISPESRILVLTGRIDPALPGELLALGVSGYVDKGLPLKEALAAVRRVLDGGLYFSAQLRPAGSRAASRRLEAGSDVPPETLTPREREIVRLVAGGLISKEIGARLKLSPRTIEKARARILEKLKVRDLPALVRWCVKHGFV